MKALVHWFLKNPVAANLLMALIIFLGVSSVLSIRIEGFPKIPADTVTIITSYPSAHLEQVDEQITQKILLAVESLNGVKQVTANSSAGVSSVSIQKNPGYSLQKLLDRVRLKVDGIGDLPSAALKPVIETSDFNMPALYIQVFGDTDLQSLQRISKELRQRLLDSPYISKVNKWGIQTVEIAIEIKPEVLKRYNLTIAEVVSRISQQSLYFQGGSIRRNGETISLLADQRANSVEEFRALPIITYADGRTLRLGDLANIQEGYEEKEIETHFNSEPSVGMDVKIGQKDNLLRVSEAAEEIIEQYQAQLPEGVTIKIWGNSAEYIADRLKMLSTSALLGLSLVVIILALFLDIKLAFWVAMGIPVATAGALAAATTSYLDYSLNDITTFGFIIVLGILVDDAVVVGESVYEQRKKIKNPLLATEAGVHRVALATVFGVLTTVAAFFPMLLIDSPMGKILASFSSVVILALLFSLVESKLILPAHLAHVSMEKKPTRNPLVLGFRATQAFFQNGLKRFRRKIYEKALKSALKHRYAVLLGFISIAVLVIGLMVRGAIRVEFFPDIPSQVLQVSLTMDPRAPLDLTRENIRRIEDAAQKTNHHFAAQSDTSEGPIDHYFTIIEGAGSAGVYMELVPLAKRKNIKTKELMKLWQANIGRLEGVEKINFTEAQQTGGGLSVQLLSNNYADLKKASVALVQKLTSIKGVSNVRNSLKSGNPELRLRLKPLAQHLGFTPTTLAMQIGYSFGGSEAQKVMREGNEVRVVVRTAREARNSLQDLMASQLKSASGQWVSLDQVATVKASYGQGSISRRNGKINVRVWADIDRDIVGIEDVHQLLFAGYQAGFEKQFPGVEMKPSGEMEEGITVKRSLIRAFLIVAFLIYALLAIPLRSYFKPLIIMSVVPFGFVGAALGHWYMGLPFSLLSFFGLLALIGVVVNDSLVMMSHYVQRREDGISVKLAAFACGRDRFQAIFLTTATTVIGLLPLISAKSEQAAYLVPAAVSLAFGELFATTITLILIPVLLLIWADFTQLLHKFKSVFVSQNMQEEATETGQVVSNRKQELA
ncbi:efflux RND transporter permease subunit [Polycladidibacter stylochi]|uniref:efflux RND transporter permease subunit n=1 Tax=Polycladidibacter stylochi TaxID=1807766 RepID=UPI0008302933|nr:efflux RND transporter permease subunit [Pseudovibrio stylochi]